MQGIYRIRNKLNDKRYIGSTQDLEEGWKERRRALRKGKYHNIPLQRAWNKYGEENFVFEVEEEVVGDNKALLAREQIYLDEGFAFGSLYNMAKDASAPMRGRHHTGKTKQKMSRASKGKPKTEKHKRNISKSKKGKNNPNYGRSPSNETRIKRSRALMGNKNGVGNENAAKPYPAFLNVKTGKNILAGHDLRRMCIEKGLKYENMRNLARGHTQSTHNGWAKAKSN